MTAGTVDPPVLVDAIHDATAFDSGVPFLDDWLRQRGLKNTLSGASRCYVVCPPQSPAVIGFYTLSAGEIARIEVAGSLRRNMPDRIPGILLGRLAVDRHWQSSGLAKALLKDAVERSVAVSRQIAARILFVHAIDERAAAFYRHFGFAALPVSSLTLALDLKDFG